MPSTMTEYTLENPLVELTFNERPSIVMIVLFAVLSLAGAAGAAYLYVVMMPAWFGFETTVLIGVFIAMLGQA